ncbi:hypothetical protein LCGC14_0610600 [marine sediment metagenome]|uniref:Uncharacterized protein n=1 Tax=marine sediment metagenome TaxID=412755 RepID=A0A0F9TU62_9ZZZZ
MRFLALVLALFLFVAPAHAVHPGSTVTADIIAQNTFTDALVNINSVRGRATATRVSISVSGTFGATVTLQRRLDGTNWRDVSNWTTTTEESYIVDQRVDLRIGVKTGNFTSGTAVVRLGSH